MLFLHTPYSYFPYHSTFLSRSFAQQSKFSICSKSLTQSFTSLSSIAMSTRSITITKTVAPLFHRSSYSSSSTTTTTTTTTSVVASMNVTAFVRPQTPLNLFGLLFVFDGEKFKLSDDTYTSKNLIEIATNIDKYFININKKGYIPNNWNLNPLFNIITQYLKNIGFKLDKVIGGSENSFSLWFNFIRINLYFLTIEVLKSERSMTFDDEGLDLLDDLENVQNNVLSSIDPFLRIQMQKRGISIINNTYIGFDTEYFKLNESKCLNELISVQTAVQARTIIKIPLYNRYDISYVHPLTSEITSYYKPKTWDWKVKDLESDHCNASEMNILNESFKFCITNIRGLKFKCLEFINAELIDLLHGVDGVKYFEDLKKDQVVFVIPMTKHTEHICYPDKNEGYSLADIIKNSQKLVINDFIQSLELFIKTIKKGSYDVDTVRLKDWFTNCKKARGRTTLKFDSSDRISLNLVRNNYLIAHYNAADLSMLKDFTQFKDDLNIVGKSFVTLGKPLQVEGSFVYIRDTHLLTPAASKGLEALGKLYPETGEKKFISQDDLEHMDEFFARDPKAFESYAIQDAVIPLAHALTLENFNLAHKRVGIPITLSSLGRTFVLDKWNEIFEKYFPYQISGEVLMGNAAEIQTPKGLFVAGDVGLHLGYYIANYKGGRGESFMYGTDTDTEWFDYDLSGAYTTAMTHLSLPLYNLGQIVQQEEVSDMTDLQLLNGYLIMNCSFKFPDSTKYPSIPCYVDKATTVYPLSGECTLTGPEYLLARNQKCEIKIKSAFYIPPTTIEQKIPGRQKPVEVTIKPFQQIVHELQTLRRGHEKGHVLNALYKEMANSIYGNVVRGIANKKSFDIKTGQMLRISGTELSNPILASWTTAFIRGVIGECLHNIHKLGGKVVSVTTDGFITNIRDLETKLLDLEPAKIPLFSLFRSLRITLTGDLNTESLELKHKTKGIISWSTRGQLGFEGKLKATTGFQSHDYTRDELVKSFKEVLAREDKQFDYTMYSLRSAKDVFKKGGHVMTIAKNQKVRLLHDNRRVILEPSGFTGHDMSNRLFDSKPHQTAINCKKVRFLSRFANNMPYLRNLPVKNNSRAKYKTFLEIGVRSFIKGYLAKEPCFGLKGYEFTCYRELMNFILGFDLSKDIRITKQSISSLKMKQTFLRPVPKTRENISFVSYIKSHLPYFDDTNFFKN
jgi:hypothetical protein